MNYELSGISGWFIVLAANHLFEVRYGIYESAICDFRANANSVKPQPIAVLFKTMGAWAVLCFASDDTDARMAIGQEMEMDPPNDEFIIYGAPSNYLLDTCNIYNKAA